MKKEIKTLLLGIFLTVYGLANAQFIDKYGVRVGGGLSNIYWNYEDERFSSLSGWDDNKLGVSIFADAEKEINRFVSIRPAIGYIQKGFDGNITVTTADGDEVLPTDEKVTFHYLSLDLGGKITPLETKLNPYVYLGLRGGWLMGYTDAEVEYSGETFGIYGSIIDDAEAFELSGVLAVGVEYNDLFYLDFEYNPSMTKLYSTEGYSLKNRYFGLTLGVHICNQG